MVMLALRTFAPSTPSRSKSEDVPILKSVGAKSTNTATNAAQELAKLNANKEAARHCLLAADKYLKESQFSLARAELDKALKLDPSNGYIYAFQDRITYFEEMRKKEAASQAAAQKPVEPAQPVAKPEVKQQAASAPSPKPSAPKDPVAPKPAAPVATPATEAKNDQPAKEAAHDELKKEADEQKRKELEERAIAEERKRKEQEALAAEEQRRRELEARAAAEEQKRKELEARVAAEEQRRKELEARIVAEEQRRKEEELRIVEEQRRRELDERAFAERRKLKELEERAAEEERRRRELELRVAVEERRRKEEELRVAEEQRRKELEERAAAERRRLKELEDRAAEEERRRRELEDRIAAEEQQRREAEARAQEELRRKEAEDRAAEERKKLEEMRRQVEELTQALEQEKKAREEISKRNLQTAVKQLRTTMEAAWVNGAPMEKVAESIRELTASLSIPTEVEQSVQREVKLEMYSRAVKEVIAKRKLLRNSSSTLEWLRKVYQVSVSEYLENESKFLLDLVADQYKGTILFISKFIGTKEDLTQRLKSSGYAVVQSPAPENALEKIEKVNPNLILCDSEFPNGSLSGLRFLHLMRANSKFNFIPFILLMERTDSNSIQASELKPNEGCIQRPVDYEELTNLMNDKLAHFRDYISSLA